jgi:hypothetical protein
MIVWELSSADFNFRKLKDKCAELWKNPNDWEVKVHVALLFWFWLVLSWV